jgi:hypothetical protein
MPFDPKRASTMSVGAALSDAVAATRRDFIPLGLVAAVLSLIPLVGPLVATPLLITAAMRSLRDGKESYVGETFSAFGDRLGEFVTTWLVSILVGAVTVIAFFAAVFAIGFAALLGSGSAPGASAGAELLLGGGLVALFVALVVYIGVRFSFIYYAAFDGKGAFDAFRQSWAISRGATLRIAGWGLVAGLVGVLITLATLLVGGVLSMLVPLLGTLLGLLALVFGGTAGLMVSTRMLATLYLTLNARSR